VQITPQSASLLEAANRIIREYRACDLTIGAIEDAEEAIAAMPPKIGADWPAQNGIYAGIARGQDGAPDYHLVLLPGEAESVNWAAAKEWAASAGGELPTRSEQALLFANLKDHFKGAWYWSGEEYVSAPEYAWSQTFSFGYQSSGHKVNELRARAVRRLAIQ